MKKEGFIVRVILARGGIDFQVFVGYSFSLKEFGVPENPEKKLGGFVVETHSSDAAISKTIEGLRQEITATVGEPMDAIIADVLPPENIGIAKANNVPVGQDKKSKLPIEKLTHKDSAYGMYHHLTRVLKKAA